MNCFIAPNRFDAREPESESASVTITRLNSIKSDFQDNFRSYQPIIAFLSDSGPNKMLR